MKKSLYILILLLIGFSQNGNAQANLDFVSNLQCGDYTYCVDVRMAANSGSFDLGTSSFLIKYNTEAVSFKNYVAVAFDSAGTCVNAWSPQQIDVDTETGEISITVKLLNPNSSCIDINSTPKIIGTICFDIEQQGGNPNIIFDAQNTNLNRNTPDNGTNAITINNFDSLNTAGVLACDCIGVGTACDDNNVYTTNDIFDINCECNGEILDADNDGIPDGIDPCIDIVYEAEDAFYYGTGIGTNHLQFYGNGFIDYQAWQSDTLLFTIDITNPGAHDITIRYANGNSWNRRLQVKIDSIVTHQDLQFPTTDTSWKVWDTLMINHNFTIGTHTILLTPPPSYAWAEPNIDRLTVSKCNGCATAGQSCDDNDPCTTSDLIDINCNCAGVFQDADNDNVCDSLDICPNGDDNLDTDIDGIPDACDSCDNTLIGMFCDDGNPCTINDTYDSNCNCIGTSIGNDTDGDGVCDAHDVCIGGDDNLDTDEDGIKDFCDTCDDRLVGMPCDDGNPCTVLDVYNAACGCGGIPIYVDISANLTDVSCNGFDDGIVDISVAGAFGELDYKWNTGDSISDLYNLAPGNYAVTVTDFRNCKDSTAYVISEPDALATTYNSVATADSTGSISLSVIGGIQPYTYNWASGDSTSNINNLIPYTYEIDIIDSNNCVQNLKIDVYPDDMCIDTVIQTEDGILSGFGKDIWNERYALGDGFIYLTDDTTETATFSINIPADGFYTIGFRYTDQWATRNVKIIIDGVVEFEELGFPRTYDWGNWQKLEFVDFFTAGTHQLVLAHANHNWGPWIDFISICDDVTVPIALDADIIDNICYADSIGSITILPTGGTRNYTYAWSTGETTATISNLLAGDYFITVTDEVGQTAIDTFRVEQPNEIIPIFTIRDAYCKGSTNGRADVEVTGGTTNYSYNWSNGPTWKSTYNVPAGTYTLTVTDANGCIDIADVIIGEPDDLTATFNNTVSAGNDGTIDLTPIGGNTPYTFFWKDSVTTEDRTNMAVGYYKVTITDTLGCRLQTATSVYPAGLCLDTIMEAEEGIYNNINYNIWTSDSATGRGYIHFSADSLGQASYTFTIAQEGYYAVGFRYSNQSIYTRQLRIDLDNVMIFENFDFPSTGVWNNYKFIDFDKYYTAGTYTITLRYRQNWSPRIDFLTVCDLSLEGLTTKIDIDCFGETDGMITTSIDGGRIPYQYLWSTNDTTTMLTNLAAGTYTVSVTDTLNQVFTETINIISPNALTISSNLTDATSGSNGAIDITPNGGTANYTFLWNNGSTTEDRTNLNPGMYYLTLTDANNCEAIDSFPIYDINGNLPVDLIQFEALPIGDAIQCNWSTASEFNNKGFWLQRSLDGFEFRNIAWIDGKGTTTEINDYGFLDELVIPNTIYYYRLLQVDFDEKFEYSNIVNAQINQTFGGVSIYPNPTSDILNIQFEKSFTGNIRIVDLLGREMLNEIVDNESVVNYDLNEFSNQIYFLIIEGDEVQYVQKILKK